MGRCLQISSLMGALALSACAGGGASSYSGDIGQRAPVECAPFARALTGVALRGDGADWWQEAAGRYRRTDAPREGALLVFRRSARLPDGHVAVVSRVVSDRKVLLTQANWVHHRISEDLPAVDVSPDNDWSLVRVWWPPTGTLGIHAYPAFGFILPSRPAGHDALLAATPGAVRLAEQE